MIYFCKMSMAFIGAIFVANCLCYFYYSPAVQTENIERYTDLKNEPSGHNPICTEGYGHIIIDGNGFSNADLFPYHEAEVLCVGSSQTEGSNVNWDENYVYLLNNKAHVIKAYNLGVSAQTFATSFYRIKALKDNFPACRTIIFEINALPSNSELLTMKEFMEKGEVPTKDLSWKKGNFALQVVGRIPLCRLLWSQYASYRKGKETSKAPTKTAVKQDAEDNYYELAEDVLRLAKQQAGETKIMLFYLPVLTIGHDGNLVVEPKKGKLSDLQAACEEQGIIFVDMGTTIIEHYTNERILPYGFGNSKVGFGHLNPQGHKMIADTLYTTFLKEGIAQ